MIDAPVDPPPSFSGVSMCAPKRCSLNLHIDNNLKRLTYKSGGSSQLCQPDKECNTFQKRICHRSPFSTGAKVWFKHNEVVHFRTLPSKIYHILCYNTILVTDRRGEVVFGSESSLDFVPLAQLGSTQRAPIPEANVSLWQLVRRQRVSGICVYRKLSI